MPDLDERLNKFLESFPSTPEGSSPSRSAATTLDQRLSAFASSPELEIGQTPESYLKRSFAAGVASKRSEEEQKQLAASQGIAWTPKMSNDFQLQTKVQERRTTSPNMVAELFGTSGESNVIQRRLIPFYSGFIGSGRVANRVNEARKRFDKGEATDDDLNALADHQHTEELQQWRGEKVGRQIADIAAGAPTVISEFGAAGKGIQLGGRALGFGRAAAGVGAADLAAAGRGGMSVPAMRAALAEPSFARVAATHAGRMGLVTPLVPSAYAEEWHQNNLRAGRDPTDFAGLPPAMLHAYGNMLVLGTMQNNFGMAGNALKRTAVKGGVFAAEQATADSLYNLANEKVLPNWLKTQTKYGTFENLLTGKYEDAVKGTVLNVFTGAMFAGLHELQAKATAKGRFDEVVDDPIELERHLNSIVGGLKEDLSVLHNSGLSASGAASRVESLHQRITDVLIRSNQQFPDVRPSVYTPPLVRPDLPPEAASDPRLQGSIEARQALARAQEDVEAGRTLTRPEDAGGEKLTAAQMLDRMTVPGTNRPSMLARRMADALRRAEKFNQPRKVEVEPTTVDKPDTSPIAPGLRQLSAAPIAGETTPGTTVAAPAKSPVPSDPTSRAVSRALGDRAVNVGELGWTVEHGNLFLSATPDAIGNRVILNFASRAEKEGEYVEPPKGVRKDLAAKMRRKEKLTPKELEEVKNASFDVSKDAVGLLRDMKKLAKELAKEGVEIAYASENRRHAMNANALKKAGYEIWTVDKAHGDDPMTNYVWKVKDRPDRGPRTEDEAIESLWQAEYNEAIGRGKTPEEADRIASDKVGFPVETPTPPSSPPEAPTPKSGGSTPKAEPSPESEDVESEGPSRAERAAAAIARLDAAFEAADKANKEAGGKGLSRRERFVLTERMTRSQQEIADELGLTRSRVQQIESEASAKMGMSVSLAESGAVASKKEAVREAQERAKTRGEAEVPESEEAPGKAPRKTANQAQYDAAKREVENLTDQLLKAEGKKAEKIAAKLKAAGENVERLGRELGIPAALLAGIPLRLTALERFFDKFSIGMFLKRFFTSAGELPTSAFGERMKMHAEIEVEGERMRESIRDLKKSLGVDYSTLTKAQLEKLNKALEGDKAALSVLRPEVESAILAMRGHVDRLSDLLVKSGAAQGKMAVSIQSNLGMYLSRQYRVFSDPSWVEHVLSPDGAAIRNRFVSWMDAEIRSIGRSPNPGESEGLMRKYLVDGTASDNPIAFLKKGNLSSKDLGILTRRKDVPEPLRELWGEVKDPLVNYANSVGRMAHLLHNHLFQKEVSRMGLAQGWLSKDPTPELFHPLAAKDSETMDGFAGLHTTKEIARAFREAYAPDQMSQLQRSYMKILALTKYAKTVGSVMTHVTNALSNLGFLARNGHLSVTGIRDSLRAMRDDTPDGRTYYEELVRQNIVNDSVMSNEFRDTMNDALEARETTASAATGFVTDRAIVRWLKKGGEIAQKLYRGEDAYAKIVAYESEKARYREANPTWTEQQVRDKAGDNVRRTYPSYSQVPRFVRGIRKVPFIGPFVSFSSEALRTTYHTAKLAFEERGSGNPDLRRLGNKRLAFLFSSMGLSVALAATTRALTMTDRNEENDMRRFLPEWESDTQLLHLGRDKDGNKMYQSLGRIDPHAYLLDAVEAGLHGESIPDAMFSAGSSLAKPFISEEILGRAIFDVARNVDERTGKEVYNEQDTTYGKVVAVAKHLGKPLLPGTIERGIKARSAYGENPDGDAALRKLAQDILGEVSGFKVRSVEPAKALRYKYRDFRDATRHAESPFEAALKSPAPADPAQLKLLYDKSEARRKEIFEEFRGDVEAAQRLGASRQSIVKSLHDAGVSAPEIGRIFGAKYTPNLPKSEDYKTLPPGEFAKRIAAIRGK